MRRLQFKFLSQIRISGWDFGPSARAMNQVGGIISTQAELKKVSSSTTERKSMSTKTTIKRIALVAVSALGFGMLSVVPSQAVFSGALTVSASAGAGSVTAGVADTSTPASVSVSGLATSTLDSITVSVVQKSYPTGGSGVKWNLTFVETTTSTLSQVDTSAGGSGAKTTRGNGLFKNTASASPDSLTSVSNTQSGSYFLTASGAGYIGATFGLLPDSTNANTKVAGTYVYTAIIQTYNAGALAATQSQDLTFVIADTAANIAAASGTIDPSKTTAVMNLGNPTTLSANDSAVAVLATASSTNQATIQVKTYTSTSLAAPESVTVTLTGSAGVICDSAGSTCGNNLKIAGDGDDKFYVRANGTAGTSTIVVATTTKTFPAKSVSFYAKSPSTITVSVNKPVIAVAAATADSNSDVVRAVAKDANAMLAAVSAILNVISAVCVLVRTPPEKVWTTAVKT